MRGLPTRHTSLQKYAYIYMFINNAKECIDNLKKEIATTEDVEYIIWCSEIIRNLKLLINQIHLHCYKENFYIRVTPDTIRALNVLISYNPTDET